MSSATPMGWSYLTTVRRIRADVLTAIACLGLLVTLLGVGCWGILHDSHRVHGRIDDLERKVTGLNGRVNTLTDEIKNTHARLIDGIFQQASEQIDQLQRDSEQIDQEIERARARGRGF
jgi:hypothetical protein